MDRISFKRELWTAVRFDSGVNRREDKPGEFNWNPLLTSIDSCEVGSDSTLRNAFWATFQSLENKLNQEKQLGYWNSFTYVKWSKTNRDKNQW